MFEQLARSKRLWIFVLCEDNVKILNEYKFRLSWKLVVRIKFINCSVCN